MGGKAKLLDSIALEQIYSKASGFKRYSEDFTEYMRFQLNQLTDPVFLDSVKVEYGEECLAAIHNSASALEELLDLIGNTSSFIEYKIGESVRVETDKHGSQDRQAVKKAINKRLSLKR